LPQVRHLAAIGPTHPYSRAVSNPSPPFCD